MDHHNEPTNMTTTTTMSSSSTNGVVGGTVTATENSNYDKVIYKKLEGMVQLTDEVLAFQSSSSSTITISWNALVKHQVSPASHPKALLKLVLNPDLNGGGGGKSATLQFSIRSELERIRKDITIRLQRYRHRKANGIATTTTTSSSSSNGMISSSSMSGGGGTAGAVGASSSSIGTNGSDTAIAMISGKKRPHSEMHSPTNHHHNNNQAILATTGGSIAGGRTTATSFGELDATALAVTRSSLLAANPSLRAQHHYLVEETQTIKEDDFWSTHQDLLEEEYARISGMARAGTSSLLQSHLQLLTGRVTLGVEEMRQIFIMYPAVHKAYEEKVPLELSDEQFWRKYLESEYFHRDRGRLGAASRNATNNGSNSKSSSSNDKSKDGKGGLATVEEQEARAAAVGTDDLFSRYDQKIKEHTSEQKDADGMISGRKWGTTLAVGQFDLASTFETERGNLLEGPKDNHPLASEDGKGSRVIQKYNRHWAMVLHPEEAVAGSNLLQVARKSVREVVPGDEDAKASGGVDTDMTRLVGFASSSSVDANHALGKGMAESDEYEELILKDIDSYYSGKPTPTNDSSTMTEEAERAIRKRNKFFAISMLSKMKKLANDVRRKQDEELNTPQRRGISSASILDDAFPQPKMGKELLSALTKKMASDSITDADTLEVVKTLPEDFKKRVHSYFRRSSELLRHFFGLRKLVDTQSQQSQQQQQQNQSSSQQHNQKLKRIVQGMENVYREMEGIRKELEQTETGEIMRKMCLQIMDQLDWAFKLHREGSGGGGGGGFVTIEEF